MVSVLTLGKDLLIKHSSEIEKLKCFSLPLIFSLPFSFERCREWNLLHIKQAKTDKALYPSLLWHSLIVDLCFRKINKDQINLNATINNYLKPMFFNLHESLVQITLRWLLRLRKLRSSEKLKFCKSDLFCELHNEET